MIEVIEVSKKDELMFEPIGLIYFLIASMNIGVQDESFFLFGFLVFVSDDRAEGHSSSGAGKMR